MDHQKTGALIAQRRHQLGMTQKTLAEKLGISDRAVSKWERGAGFPDISLIEPLAEALDLTVLELLHGQPAPPAPEEERSAREVLNSYRPEIRERQRRDRRWILVLAALLAAAAAVLVWTIGRAGGEWIGMEEISAAEAAAASPYILITEQDCRLLEKLRQDETIAQCLEEISAAEIITLDEAFSESHLNYVDFQGQQPEFVIVQVLSRTVHVEYGDSYIHISLDHGDDGSVTKTVTLNATPYRTENGVLSAMESRSVLRHLVNKGNMYFRSSLHETAWAALFS